jgi:hypothetical protein
VGVSFAVVACSSCRQPWAVEQRHATVTCPACRKTVELAHRTQLWSGQDAREAQRQAAHFRAELTGKGVSAKVSLYQPGQARPSRHDSPAEEAAASGRGIANKGSRAEMVASTLVRLRGPVPHAELVASLQLAGLDEARAEAEVTRMLAMDILLEPKAGQYRVVA